MVHYLRKNNVSLIETEAFSKEDFSSAVYIRGYSEYLLSLTSESQRQLTITLFNSIYQLRELWWTKEKNKMELNQFLKKHYTDVANALNLEYVVD